MGKQKFSYTSVLNTLKAEQKSGKKPATAPLMQYRGTPMVQREIQRTPQPFQRTLAPSRIPLNLADGVYNRPLSEQEFTTMGQRPVSVRSPTIEQPGTPEEIDQAFNGPTPFAPGASRAQTAAAQARLASKRFAPGQYAAYQRSIGVNPSQAAPSPLMQALTPSTQESTPSPQESYFRGRSGEPGMGASNQALGSRYVGPSVMSSGMNTGGYFGSSLLMGGMPAGRQRDLSPAPLPNMPSPSQVNQLALPERNPNALAMPSSSFANWQAENGAKSNLYAQARSSTLRTALGKQQRLAADNPTIASNITANANAAQRMRGGAPVLPQEQIAANVQANALQRALARKGRQPGSPPSGDAMDNYLLNVAQNAPNPEMAAKAAQMYSANKLAREQQAATATQTAAVNAREDKLANAEVGKSEAEAKYLGQMDPNADRKQANAQAYFTAGLQQAGNDPGKLRQLLTQTQEIDPTFQAYIPPPSSPPTAWDPGRLWQKYTPFGFGLATAAAQAGKFAAGKLSSPKASAQRDARNRERARLGLPPL